MKKPQKDKNSNSEEFFEQGFSSSDTKIDIEVFENEEVFKPNYVPEQLYFRSDELFKIGDYLSPLNEGTNPEDVSIYGQTGTGKTAVMKYVTDQIHSRFEDRNNVNMVYISCREQTTKREVYSKVADEIIPDEVPRSGHSTDRYFEFIKEYLEEKNGVLVVVLDEIDFLQRNKEIDVEELLYNFTDKNNISIIIVSNNRKWKENIKDSRVFSRMGISEIQFSGYSENQIKLILEDRAEKGLNEDIWDKETIEHVAHKAAGGEGDARVAIKILHQAAKKFKDQLKSVTNPDPSKITRNHIKEASKLVETDRFYTEYIRNLPAQKKFAMAGIALANKKPDNSDRITEKPTLTRVYKKYKKVINGINENSEFDLEIKRRPTIWRYINELTTYGFVSKYKDKPNKKSGRPPLIVEAKFDVNRFLDKWNNTDEIIEEYNGTFL